MNIFSKIVSVTAERSSCERLRVWCLLVKDNRIISQGYNGHLPGCVHESIFKNNNEQALFVRNKMLYVFERRKEALVVMVYSM